MFNKANNAKAEILTKMLKQSGSIVEIESGLLRETGLTSSAPSEPTRSLLNINDAVCERRIADYSLQDNAKKGVDFDTDTY